MSVTEERRSTTRRRGTARAAARRARARPEDEARSATEERAELRAPTDRVLPPGHRDASGFWIPEGYDVPEALFSPHQRRLQEKQRQAHRARRERGEDAADPDDAAAFEGADDDGDRVDSPDPND